MDAVNNVAFPRQDARTLADDGNALRFCSTCAFSQACLDEGMDKASLGELHVLVEHVGPFHPGEHVFREGDPFEAIAAVRAMVSWKRVAEKPRADSRRDIPTRNAATRWSALQSPASSAARPISRLSRRNSSRCTPGTRVASTEIFGNEKRHSITVSSAIASHG